MFIEVRSFLRLASFRLRALAALGVLFIAFSARADHSKTVAIIGDSVATGAVSHHRIDARFSSLATNFVVHHGYRDYEGSQGGLNYPENAFSQIIATGFGVKPENVINVAKNGDRVDSIATQFQKIQQLSPNQFPNYILLSFTANDACSEEIFTTSIVDFKRDYLRNLLEGANAQAGLRYIVRAAPKDRDTSIFLLASLNFPQVLTNRKILDHTVPLHFSEVRCERFRAGKHSKLPLASWIADGIGVICPAVLKTDPNGTDDVSISRRSHLQFIHRAMVEAQAEAIEILKRESVNPRLSFRFISSPSAIDFNETQVANDCFHLSNQGQGTLGWAAWTEIFAGQ